MPRIQFYWSACDGAAYADRKEWEAPITAVTRSLARRVGADVVLTYDHAATLDRGSDSVYRVQWYDVKNECFREETAILPSAR